MTLEPTTAIGFPNPLISAAWLADHLHQPGLKILDATFRMPGVAPTAGQVYAAAHLPGAMFFDIDAVADHATDLPHMLPEPAAFERAMAALGVGADDGIVLYDTTGILGAARVWWMLRVFGHGKVAILDGGLDAWRGEGRPVTAEIAHARADTPFKARLHPEFAVDRARVMGMVESGDTARLLDARAAGRFTGAVAEPRPGLRAGHIPGSRNLDHATLIDPATGKLKPLADIETLFRAAESTLDRPMVTSCGSGVSACVLAFCLHLMGKDDVAIYDGSWAEWGVPGPTPVELG
jgi:thiosulfate/3-mercaptopyruvate sulfurtransferase